MTYGLVIGLLYSRSRWQCVVALYYDIFETLQYGSIC